MHIFSYKWPDNGLSAEQITELKEWIDNRTLVFFQNFPESASADFPGGKFSAKEEDSTRGCYAYSAEEGVMDMTNWMIEDLTNHPCAQAIHIFSEIIVNIDLEAGTAGQWTAELQNYIEAEEKVVAVVGHFGETIELNGFGTVKPESTDTNYGMAKTGHTIIGMEKWEHGIGAKNLQPIGFQLLP